MGQWAEWLFYYAVYGFGGWLLENVYSRVAAGVFWKEGFLFTPLKPMYGLAMTVLAAVWAQGAALPVMVFLSVVIPTGIEFASGLLLHKGFGRRYWDYSGMRGSIGGYVCLAFSLCWIPLSLGCLYGLHPLVRAWYAALSPGWDAAAPWVAALMAFELAAASMKRRMPAVRNAESSEPGIGGEEPLPEGSPV
ncbi:putative ABC transporter permease [Gorillibacterium sp. sgz500922]|uniref:putative ABC transporter permease n=1 Tax=Gorillibacterium sp. sgz500922 TaxID=3446694 RepID=UPI003F666CA6